MDVGLTNETVLKLNSSVQNLTVRVAAYTGAGDGPWSKAILVFNLNDGKSRGSWRGGESSKLLRSVKLRDGGPGREERGGRSPGWVQPIVSLQGSNAVNIAGTTMHHINSPSHWPPEPLWAATVYASGSQTVGRDPPVDRKPISDGPRNTKSCHFESAGRQDVARLRTGFCFPFRFTLLRDSG